MILKMNDKKIIIIGGGQASCQVATSLRQKKFTGDIRVNLCGALDAHIEKIISYKCVDDVMID